MKKTLFILPALVLCLCALPARADFGGGAGGGPCDTSPENPTVILAAIGSSGAGLAALRTRLKARRSSSKQQ